MSDSARDLSRDHVSMTPVAPDSNTKNTTRRPPADPRKPIRHPKSKIRRDMMRALGICINGHFIVPPPPSENGEPQKANRAPTISHRPIIEHGPAVKGGRCQRCIDARDKSKVAPQQRDDLVRATPPYVLIRLPKAGIRRRVFVDLLLSGMSAAEVAVAENTSPANVHSAVRYARRRGELA
jgi:hypothetical protein